MNMQRVGTPSRDTERASHTDRADNPESFSRIVSVVTGAGLTQAQLGQAVGSSLRTVQNWLTGDAIPTGQRVTKLLDISFLIDELKTAYTDEGIRIWLHSRNRNLERERPIDMLAEGRLDAVLEEARRVSGAM